MISAQSQAGNSRRETNGEFLAAIKFNQLCQLKTPKENLYKYIYNASQIKLTVQQSTYFLLIEWISNLPSELAARQAMTHHV